MSRRTERVNSLLRQEISTLLQTQLRDPRLAGLVTITEVEVAKDLMTARVFVSVLGTQDDRQAALTALDAARGFIRHALRDNLDLRPIPDLQFVSDTSIEEGARVTALLNKLSASKAENA